MKTFKRCLPALAPLFALVAASLALFAQTATYDVLIRGGRIIDGTGNPWFQGDVAIKDGRIISVGHLANATATRVIDATGLVVTPGFIDLHTHSDLSLLADGNGESKVRDGVTLDVIGESTSVAPRDGLPAEKSESVQQDWTNFSQYFQKIEKQGISMNLISHVSAQQIRRVVLGYDDRAANPDEIERMKDLVARSMKEGAWGLVARYEGGGPDHPEEIIEMAKVAAALGGNYTTHIGDEGVLIRKELLFALRVADETRIPVHIFHMKIRGSDNWDFMPDYIAQIENARKKGLDITVNQYPYTAMSKGWSTLFPVWVRAGGPAKFVERLKDPAMREKIKSDPYFRTMMKENGWADIALANSSNPEVRKYAGMRITEIAKLRGDSDPADTCISLMAEDGGRISGVFHNQSEENIRMVMRQPWVSIASDGSAISANASGVPHPREFATNARVLGYYVREQHVLTLEDAVRKMTSFPAQILGLTDRGQVRAGFAADVVVFDPDKVRETNSYEKPKSYPDGIPYVLVNGGIVIDKGQHTGARPGKVIRGRAYQSPS
jgi:dihydroorotase/N-acyl-D-amino-acid deacylase